jgi:NAD dependent epimerase/dehydratase
MKVLVTGSGGFIGSHVVEKCLVLGYRVKAFVRYNSRNRWGWLEGMGSRGLEVVAGDIRDEDSVLKAMRGCSTVFHLAALIGIPYSYASPMAYIKTNIEGTYNILEAAKTLEMENVLITSTSETYGTAQYVPIDENHPLVGQSPYSASKIGADQLALSYYRSFGTPVKIVRPFNTYGPRQSARAVIPTIITQILAGKRKIKLGNLGPTRDLTFVKDTVEGFIAIHQCPSLVGEVTNIGMNQEISIGDLARLISKKLKIDIEITGDKNRVRPEKSEVERLWCDNRKIWEKTGWKPKYNLERGLEETIRWVKMNLSLYKETIYNV